MERRLSDRAFSAIVAASVLAAAGVISWSIVASIEPPVNYVRIGGPGQDAPFVHPGLAVQPPSSSGPIEVPAVSPGPAPVPVDSAKAAGIFSSKCAGCHGADRQGGFGPALTAATLSNLSVDTLTDIVTKGRGRMPALGLPAEDAGVMAQWLKGGTAAPPGGAPSPAPTPAPTPSPSPAPGGPINAAQLFGSKCAGCHGANREGGFGPPLNGASLSNLSAGSIANIITGGRGPMPAFSVTAAEADALAQFLKGASTAPPGATPTPTPSPSPAPGGPINAAQLFGSKCAGCHGANREGGFGPPLNGASLANLSAGSIANIITGGRGPMPAFSVTAAEADALAQFLKGVSTAPPGVTPTPTPTPPPSAGADPAQIFASRCAGCHGANRQGGSGPALTATALANLTADTIANTITSGRGGMPAFGSMLPAADITNVAKFLKGEAVALPPPGTTPAPLPEMTPKELYISNCATCHGADRQGGRGPALLGKTVRPDKTGDVAKTIVRGEDGMPSFRGVLTPQQIVDLARYLTSTPVGILSQ